MTATGQCKVAPKVLAEIIKSLDEFESVEAYAKDERYLDLCYYLITIFNEVSLFVSEDDAYIICKDVKGEFVIIPQDVLTFFDPSDPDYQIIEKIIKE